MGNSSNNSIELLSIALCSGEDEAPSFLIKLESQATFRIAQGTYFLRTAFNPLF